MTKNKDLNYLKKLLAKEKRKEQEKVDIIGSLENRINHAETTVDSILGLENSKQKQLSAIKNLDYSKYNLSKIAATAIDREERGNGSIKYTYQYSYHCLMRHNKGGLRYGYATFFDPYLVNEIGTKKVDLTSLRPQTFIDKFNEINVKKDAYSIIGVEELYERDWCKIKSPYGYESWQGILAWLTNLYFACPSYKQNQKLIEKDFKFDFHDFESRNIEWNHDSIQALEIPFSKVLNGRWSYGIETRVIAHYITNTGIEPRYISKDFCIENFYQDIPSLPSVGEKEADSSFIMMLPKKVCQYIMAGVPENAIIEDNLTEEHKKLLPKKEDDAYCPDQVAILVITNKKWRELVKEQCDLDKIAASDKGFGKASKYDNIKKASSNNKDHPDAYLFKPGFKIVALTDEAMYCFADYNWETGTKNIESIPETIRQHCNWNGNEVDDEFSQDDFEEGHMLFNGLINIAANAIIDQNREKQVIEIESLGLSRSTKEETTEKKDYKKPIKWITTEREKRKKYIYPEDHVPQKGSPKSEHIRSGHWRTVWIGRGKDKQKSRVWINEMYVKGNKEKN